jgi:hypothetical protein
MIHVWKKNSHYRSYRYKWETSQKRKLVGRMHSVGRVLSFIFSRQNCFFPTPHPQSNVSRAKGKRGRDTFASEWGGGSYWKRLSFDEGIYTVVLYFYMYYVLIWAKRENRRWGWMIMIHVPRHHNIELIAKYRTVAESVLCEGCVVWRHAAHHTQIRWFVRLTLSIRHVTMVPIGNKTFYWPPGSIYLPAANRNAFYIHVGRQAYVCARDSSYTQLTADTWRGGGGKYCIISFQHVCK